MTQEEKAKAYDEALERAKECHIDGLSLHQPVKDVIEHIFPELKESEDEKIRKVLVDMFKGYNIQKVGDFTDKEIIAWLEKQGEHKPATKLELDENGEPILTPFEAELFSMMSDAWQGYLLGEEVNIAEIVKEHSVELLEKANEQKPAWSEEDDRNLSIAIQYVFQHGYLSTVNWLKSLKQRIGR